MKAVCPYLQYLGLSASAEFIDRAEGPVQDLLRVDLTDEFGHYPASGWEYKAKSLKLRVKDKLNSFFSRAGVASDKCRVARKNKPLNNLLSSRYINTHKNYDVK